MSAECICRKSDDMTMPRLDIYCPACDGPVVAVCQICLQPSSRSVCDGCESTGGLFGDWRSDCGEGT